MGSDRASRFPAARAAMGRTNATRGASRGVYSAAPGAPARRATHSTTLPSVPSGVSGYLSPGILSLLGHMSSCYMMWCALPCLGILSDILVCTTVPVFVTCRVLSHQCSVGIQVLCLLSLCSLALSSPLLSVTLVQQFEHRRVPAPSLCCKQAGPHGSSPLTL